ncbi:MAG: tetratricopeptide repeat protein [bacterium]
MRQIKRGHYEKDEFQTIMNKVIRYIVRHRETSMFVAVIVLIGVVLLVFMTSGRERQNPEADMLYTQSMGLATMGRFQEAETNLLELTSKYSGTRAGKIGYYYLGAIYYNTGRFDQALVHFEKFLSLQKKDYLLVPSALYGAACSAEGLKDYETALGYYEKVTHDKESPFYSMGMLAYGRVTGLLGDKAKAREILNKLLEQEPSQEIATDARFYIGYFND